MATIGRDTTISWLGHATFHIQTPGGKKVLIDAWVDGNPSCPDEWKQRVRSEGVDVIFLTHGHFDHIADILALANDTGATIVGQFDITGWIASKGVSRIAWSGSTKAARSKWPVSAPQ